MSSSLVIPIEFFKLLLFMQYFVILVFLVKYNNFSNNSFSFHFIFFSLFIVAFLLRLWETVKRTKEPYFLFDQKFDFRRNIGLETL